MANSSFLPLLVAFLSMVTISTSQQLKVEYSSVKMLIGESCHRLYYDGDDSIYIFGGCLGPTYVQKYSIENDQISQFPNLPGIFDYGNIQPDKGGNLFLFGSGIGRDRVYKYNLISASTIAVATLPFNIYSHPTAFCSDKNSTVVYILGGANSPDTFTIISFDMETYEISEYSTTLPTSLAYASSICVDGRVFVFKEGGSVWEFNLNSQELTLIGEYGILENITPFPSLVSDGSYIYIVPGFNLNQNQGHEGILKFDFNQNSINFLPVENWPVKDGERFFGYSPQALFVPRLNRIYGFGGLSYNIENIDERYHDEIFYIDMGSLEPTGATTEGTTTTMNPDFFSCYNRTNGYYPHPTDCSLFIQCVEGESVHLSCPPPFLFNPIDKLCDFPETVDCGTSCISKPNGFHPHPHDCALYIFCRDEVATFFKCPSGYYFDPIIQACNLADAVSCNSH